MLLCLDDCYLRSISATVVSVQGLQVTLDKTCLYPQGGGVPGDTGTIVCKGQTYRVTDTKKGGTQSGCIHLVDRQGLTQGDVAELHLDWNRRYQLMRMHTAAHLLCALFHTKTGALVTGNQIAEDKTRLDFNLETLDADMIGVIFAQANDLIKQGAVVKIYSLPRSEALSMPGMVKLANALPPAIDPLRIVEIEGIDIQADGGCHVANIKEIGELVYISSESKGKNNKRISFKLQ